MTHMATSTAQLRYLRMPARKVRFVIDTIRGCSVNDAEARLMVSPRRPSMAVLKLLRSAVANAKQNAKLDPAKLVVREIRVDQGPKTRRWNPRARGGAALIERKSCHVSITLAETESSRAPRYTIQKLTTPKSSKDAKKPARAKKDKDLSGEDRKESGAGSAKSGKGYLRRVFRRKSV